MLEPPDAPLSSIAAAIEAEGGRVTFARFMELALTHPTLGYYSSVDRLLRHGGDFSTAPAVSPFFNRTLARLVTELVDAFLATATVERPSVVELGGGEGQLAEAMLGFWARERPELREKVAYRIVEVGARLRQRQAAAVSELAAAGWNVGWGRDLTEACGDTHPVVVVGNEFLDAIPVHLVEVRNGTVREAYVTADGPDLVRTCEELSPEAAAEIELLFGSAGHLRLETLTKDGALEVFPGLGDLMRQLAEAMPSGSFVTVDYGEWFPGVPREGQTWGIEDRATRRRSIRGYFKHQMVTDVIARAGRQDLTADVDFAAVDLHGRREHFQTILFTTLAAFLRAGGAEAELQALHSDGGTAFDPLEADRQATVLKNLLDERDLGGAFKLMVQARE